MLMSSSTYSKERKKLSQLLVEAREAAGLTQSQVAKSGVVSQTELSKMENGQRKVDFLVLIKLSVLYKRDIMSFVPKTK